jgi:galactokinase
MEPTPTPAPGLSLSALSGDTPRVVALLQEHGLDVTTAGEKAALFKEAADVLIGAGSAPDTAAKAFFVPGRIEVMGKHTDYAGGRSLLAATSKAFCVVTTEREDAQCRFFSTAPGADEVTLPMSADLEPRQGGHWTNYPGTALRRLSANFPGLLGVDVSIACDIPAASGMSTSSAIICAVFLAVDARNDLRSRPEFKANITSEEELWEYLGCNENGQSFKGLVGDKGVGTFGGSEDHTAIMSCGAGALNMFSYCPTRREAVVAWPEGLQFVIGVSGQVAEKTGDKMQDYNDASLLAREATRVYSEATKAASPFPHLAAVCESVGNDAAAIRGAISAHFAAGGGAQFTEEQLQVRFTQFFEESEQLVGAVAAALAAQDWAAFASAVARSQELTTTHLQVS